MPRLVNQRSIRDYDKSSNLRIEWMPREHWVRSSRMSGDKANLNHDSLFLDRSLIVIASGDLQTFVAAGMNILLKKACERRFRSK